jgi:hypothetical protein
LIPPLADPTSGDGSSPPAFDRKARQVFERALDLKSQQKSLGDGELRQSLLELCDAARGDGCQAEALIVQLKRSWASVPANAESHERSELVSQLISICIREFYRDGK